jgi:hypothetical protein
MNNSGISLRLISDRPSPIPIKPRTHSTTSKASDRKITLTAISQTSRELLEMLEYCSMTLAP